MRRVLRWMLLISLLVGATWASTSLEIQGKTAFGHARAWWKKQDLRAYFDRDTQKSPEKSKKTRAKPKKKEAERAITPAPAPAPVEKEATAKRVAILEKAAAAIERDAGNPGAKTTLGEKPSATEKRAIEELISSKSDRR